MNPDTVFKIIAANKQKKQIEERERENEQLKALDNKLRAILPNLQTDTFVLSFDNKDEFLYYAKGGEDEAGLGLRLTEMIYKLLRDCTPSDSLMVYSVECYYNNPRKFKISIVPRDNKI